MDVQSQQSSIQRAGHNMYGAGLTDDRYDGGMGGKRDVDMGPAYYLNQQSPA